MKVREIIKPFIAGIAVVLIPVAICATTNFTGTAEVKPYEPKWDVSFMSYVGGVVDDKTERYYQRGKDWIIIKDFPEIIDNYAGHYQNITDTMWAK